MDDSSETTIDGSDDQICLDGVPVASIDTRNELQTHASIGPQEYCGVNLIQFTNVKGALSTMVGVAAARCGFLAGFSYYELSRLSSDDAYRVPGYPILLLGCFTFAVVCGGLWAFMEMHRMRVDPSSEALDVDRRLSGVAWMAYNSYKAAFFLYTLALSLMVEVFNPVAIDKSPKWGHFWFGLFTFERFYLFVLIVGLLMLEYQFTNLKFQSGQVMEKCTLREDVESVTLMANKFGNRALLMVGFIQHAVARYNYIPTGAYMVRDDAGGKRSAEIWLNAMFWHAIILSCGCLLAVVFLSSLIYVSLHAVPISPEFLRRFFLTKVRRTWQACRACFIVGLLLVLVGASMTGWGCSGQCNLATIPDGACYAKVAYVPVVACSVSLVTILLVGMYAKSIALRARRDVAHANGTEALDSMYQKSSADVNVLQAANARTISVLGCLGDASTIAAAFVMYNITTFDTDIIHGPFILMGSRYFGLTLWGYGFLWANWLAFALGVASAMSVLVVELQFLSLRSCVQQRAYLVRLRKGVGTNCCVLFACALSALIVSFGLFGLAKMDTVRLEPAVVAIIGILMIFLETVYVYYRFRQVKRLMDPRTEGSTEGLQTFHELRLRQVQASSARALLFGGFAYNAVNFLFRSSAIPAPFYASGMGLSFISAMYATLCEGIVNMLTTSLKTDFQKSTFVARISGTLARLQVASFAYIVCFMMSFTIMGYVKLWDYDKLAEADEVALSCRYGWMQAFGGAIALVMIVQQLVATGRSAKRIREFDPKALNRNRSWADLSLCLPNRSAHPWKLHQNALNIRADAVVFQLGNVFYEILFSEVGIDQFANYAYFSMSVVTLVLGSIVVSMSALLSIWGDSVAERGSSFAEEWVRRTRNKQRLLEALYTLSLYSWMLAMIFSSQVKYPKLWYASTAWSCLGLILISIGALHVRRLSRIAEKALHATETSLGTSTSKN